MGKRVADQHEVVERWREIAGELAFELASVRVRVAAGVWPDLSGMEDALRRYEEARNG